MFKNFFSISLVALYFLLSFSFVLASPHDGGFIPVVDVGELPSMPGADGSPGNEPEVILNFDPSFLGEIESPIPPIEDPSATEPITSDPLDPLDPLATPGLPGLPGNVADPSAGGGFEVVPADPLPGAGVGTPASPASPASPAAATTKTPPKKFPDPLKGVSPQVLVGLVLIQVLGLTGTLALVMFIYGGLVWMTAAGVQEKVIKGKNIFQWASIGIIVIFSAYAAVRTILKALGAM